MKYSAVILVVALAAVTQAHQVKVALPIEYRFQRPGERIVGGQEVEPHSIPYQVGLYIPYEGKTAFCGGSIISESWVLTAAHCGELSNDITVIAGAHEITNANETTQVIRKSKSVHVHQAWNSTSLQNDIALIELDTPLDFNEAISAVKLPKREDEGNNFADYIAVESGWGITSDDAETISPVLNSVEAPVLTNLNCRLKFGILGALIPLHESNVCTDGADGKSTCSGDSGGPLTVLNKDGQPQHIGLTSFGISLGCAAGYPAVFTRTTSFLDWIQITSGINID